MATNELSHPEFAESEAFQDFIIEIAPRNEDGDIGLSHYFKGIEADTLEQLLELIDKQEERLIGDSEDAWFDLKQACKAWINDNPVEIVN